MESDGVRGVEKEADRGADRGADFTELVRMPFFNL